MEELKMALESITEKKSRSFLTMLGILIGVGAVLILVTVVTGMNADRAAARCAIPAAQTTAPWSTSAASSGRSATTTPSRTDGTSRSWT